MSMKRMGDWGTRGLIRPRRFLEVKVATLHSPPAGEPKKSTVGSFCVDLCGSCCLYHVARTSFIFRIISDNHIIVASKLNLVHMTARLLPSSLRDLYFGRHDSGCTPLKSENGFPSASPYWTRGLCSGGQSVCRIYPLSLTTQPIIYTPPKA
jgi:hypothetical protein